MRKVQHHIWLIICLFLIGNNNRLHAQKVEERQAYDQSVVYIQAFKNDSALIILDGLLAELSQQERLNSLFALQVKLRQAEALEKNDQNELAIQKLIELKETSKEKEIPKVYANACLILARLFEKIERGESCKTNLEEAQQLIQENGLEDIYPLFAVRNSSYQRFYGEKDTAFFYANEALKTATVFNQLDNKADGHLLLGLLTDDPTYNKNIKHLNKAAEIFWKIGDYSGYSAMMFNIARLYLKKKNISKALTYNNLALKTALDVKAEGAEPGFILFEGYKFRGKIFRQIGRHDSAWHYLNKGYQMEIDYFNLKNNERVIEIDAKYQDQQKIEKIETQDAEIKYERSRRNLLIGLIGLALVSIGVITFYFLRMRKASRKMERQSQKLTAALQNQLMLQSEVHHRVKNNLQVIISLLELQMEDIDDPKMNQVFEGMSNRIYSMSAIHEILYNQDDMAQVNFADYVDNLCMHFSYFSSDEKKPQFNIHFKEQYFNLETSMPLGLMLTELITNSLKYARVEEQKLIIDISLDKTLEGYHLIYHDNGPGFTPESLEEKESGLGTYLLRSMSRQLSGRLDRSNADGARYQILFKEKNVQ